MSKLTRKHFQALADLVNRDGVIEVDDLADYLTTTNPAFNRSTFKTACQVAKAKKLATRTTQSINDFRRSYVMDRMCPSGAFFDSIEDKVWEECYLLGNGFGDVDRRWAQSQCWDWSHIRDSNVEGVDRMYNFLVGKSID